MIVPYEPEHLTRLLLQPSQAIMQSYMTDPEYGAQLAAGGPAYSLVEGNEVFACAGLIPQWENRAVAWALISAEAGRHFRAIHTAVLRSFEMHPFRRIETSVDCDFEQGHRWMALLGFEREGRMRSYTPHGNDHDLYARIR